MMGGYGNGIGWGWPFLMGLFWLVLLGVIIYLVVRLLPSGGSGAGRPSGPPATETPEDILDRRFARGEIDLETYQVQRAALAKARGSK
jgi:putative membrane protein